MVVLKYAAGAGGLVMPLVFALLNEGGGSFAKGALLDDVARFAEFKRGFFVDGARFFAPSA